jgi:hypothetical protein
VAPGLLQPGEEASGRFHIGECFLAFVARNEAALLEKAFDVENAFSLTALETPILGSPDISRGL